MIASASVRKCAIHTLLVLSICELFQSASSEICDENGNCTEDITIGYHRYSLAYRKSSDVNTNSNKVCDEVGRCESIIIGDHRYDIVYSSDLILNAPNEVDCSERTYRSLQQKPLLGKVPYDETYEKFPQNSSDNNLSEGESKAPVSQSKRTLPRETQEGPVSINNTSYIQASSDKVNFLVRKSYYCIHSIAYYLSCICVLFLR